MNADVTRLTDETLRMVRKQAYDLFRSVKTDTPHFWRALWVLCCNEVKLRRETREALARAYGDVDPGLLRADVEEIRRTRP